MSDFLVTFHPATKWREVKSTSKVWDDLFLLFQKPIKRFLRVKTAKRNILLSKCFICTSDVQKPLNFSRRRKNTWYYGHNCTIPPYGQWAELCYGCSVPAGHNSWYWTPHLWNNILHISPFYSPHPFKSSNSVLLYFTSPHLDTLPSLLRSPHLFHSLPFSLLQPRPRRTDLQRQSVANSRSAFMKNV